MLYEHLHRYHFAQRFCHGRRVLDLGCGEGYGSAILAEVAEHVVGIDIDRATIAHARASYERPGLQFLEGSMLDPVDVRGGHFDVVVCLEAIEHIDGHELLMEVIRNALTPSGVAVISTPDRTIYTEAADYHNPFHVHELSRDEFCELLSGTFKHVTMLGQRTTVGSRIDRLGEGKGDLEEVVYVARAGDAWVERESGPVPYLLAVASDLDEMVPDSSTLIDVDLTALRAAASVEAVTHDEELAGVVEHLTAELEEARADRSRLEAQHYAHDAQIGALEQSIKDLVRLAGLERESSRRAQDEADALRATLESERTSTQELAAAIELMRSSRGWRVLESLRGIRANVRGLRSSLLGHAGRDDQATPHPG